MTALPATIPFTDPELPVEVLLTGEAEPALATAVAAAGASIADIRIAQVRYRPLRSITVSYVARVGGPDGIREATLVMHAGAGMPEGAVLLEAGEVRLGVWRFPNDPALPGLRHAVDAELLGALLPRLGIRGVARTLRTRSYRPGRRAVIDVTTAEERVFLKVVRPAKVGALLRRHELLAGVPVPRLAGTEPELGIVALGAMAGIPLRDAIGKDGPLPGAGELAALLDRLPPTIDTAAPGPVERITEHGRLLRAVVPELAAQIDRIEASVVRPADSGGMQPVHGDFHAGQVMTAGGSVQGLIDVDTVGGGRRADDLGSMIGYLGARAADPGVPPRVATYADELRAGFEPMVETTELRCATAAALVGFATLPFITQAPDWPAAIGRRIRRADAAASGRW